MGVLSKLLGEEAAIRFRRDRAAMFGLGVVGLLVVFAIAGPWLIPYDPNASDFSLVRGATRARVGEPSAAHWLGTDAIFRDVLSRLAHGARVSLAVAVLATIMSAALGAIIGVTSGSLAGTRLRAVDTALMRVVDVLLALPFLLFVTAIGVAVGRADVGTILLVLGLTSWAGTARLIRAKTLQIRELDFVIASRALGAGALHVARRHILPNIAGTLLVVATLSVGQMILAEAVLGYLTVGVQPPRATWGRMLHESEQYLGTRPLLVMVPGFAILLAVLGVSRVGEGLRDALDPRAGRALSAGRKLPFDLLIAAAALLLVSFAPRPRLSPPIGVEPDVDQPVRGGVLHVATAFNVRSLDPALAYDEGALPLEELLFARLVTFSSDGQIEPDLARDVVSSEDGLRYSFRLRDGLRFHDGSELRAADVKRSIERSLHSKSGCPAASSYAMIRGFDAFHSGKAEHLEGVRVASEQEIEITLDQPDATFLPLMTLAFMAPVCPAAGPFADARNQEKPCGAGPFRLEAWEPDEGVRLARFEAYHRPGLPYLDGIDWQLGVRWSTQRYAFEEGKLDYIRELSGTDTALFRADPAWSERGRWVAKPSTQALFLNTELAPFNDRAMRRAAAFALDPSVLERVSPTVIALDRVLPESIPGPERSTPMRRHSKDLALAEMARAGYPFDPVTGKGGYPREIELVTIPGTFEQQAAEIFQQQLARVGIRVRLRLVSYPTYLAEVARRRTVAMGTTGWTADFPDASNFFEPTLSSSSIQNEGSQNYAFFSSHELDRVLASAHREQNKARRFDLYAKAEALVRDEAPWIPTYGTRALVLWHPYLRGYAPNPLVPERFTGVWLDPAARSRGSSRSGQRASAILDAPFGAVGARGASGRDPARGGSEP